MAIKELKTRIALKYDSYSTWMNDAVEGKGANLVLLTGEVGICAIPADFTENGDTQVKPTVLFKVGDGVTPFKDLPWASAKAADVYSWAKKTEEEFKAWLNETAGFAKDSDITELGGDIATLVQEIADIKKSLGSGDEGEVVEGTFVTRLAVVENTVSTITGDKNTAGSIKKAEADAKAYADSLANNYDEAGAAAGALTEAKSYTDSSVNQLRGEFSTLNSTVSGLTTAKNDHEDRLVAIETFFEGAAKDEGEGESLKNALDTLVEIQDYITSDGAAGATLLNKVTALENTLKTGGEFETRVKTIEGVVATNSGNITDLQNLTAGDWSDKTIKETIDAVSVRAEKGITDADTAAKAAKAAQDEIDALELVVGNADSGLIKLVSEVKGTADTAAANVATASGKITTIETLINDASKGNEKLRTDIDALQVLTGDASKGNEKLRSDLTTIMNAVNDEATGLAATKAIADQNKSDISTLNGKVATIESDYLKEADEFIFSCGSSSEVTYTLPENV